MRMPAFEIWLRTMGVSLSVVIALATSPAGLAAAGNQAVSQAPTADQIVNQLQENGGVFPGFRRNHAKGVCVSGYFESSGGATRYSVAQVFISGERTPVIGRLSIPGTNPYAWDDGTPIRGMALMFLQADGQQWRTAMNAVPFFPVATPAANYEFLKAQQPLPTTGDPDPKKLAAFFASHPTANAFRIWDRTTKLSASYATVQYNSLDSFYLVDAESHRYAVRWSMVPEAIADGRAAPTDQPDFLATDLRQRLSQGPLRWRLVVTLANPGDRVNDAAIAWLADRRHIDAGTLVIRASQPQSIGVCRDISFNPLVLPRGIEPSDDPLLQDRAETYAESLRRRLRDESRQHATTVAPSPSTHPQ
ncbi:MAG: catalase family peroxidase [Gammaproteobacteria bacterium]|nr:catalase family peroxidase [Gammaproteobacteria bacterium]